MNTQTGEPEENPESLRPFDLAQQLQRSLERPATEPTPLAELITYGYEPGDEIDATGESVQPLGYSFAKLPPKAQERRGLLIGLGIAFVGVLLLQLGFALFLNDDSWARVGPILSGFSTIVAGGLGAAAGYYFSGKD